jgi:hypothetical protein
MNEKQEKRRDALNLFIESVYKPDSALRQCAHEQKCYHELMEWREEVLMYLFQKRSEEFHS